MFARTERLLLRPGWAEDAPVLATAIADESIVRNLATAPWPYALEDAQRFLDRPQGPLATSFLMFRRTGGAPKLVGSVGFGATPDGEVELGYWIARPYWGLGYATEGAQAVIDLTRDSLRLNRLVASHFLDNPASARVLAKLGFRPTGRVRPRFSLARGTAAPCRELVLDLGSAKEGSDELAACAQRSAFNFAVMAA